MAEDERSRLLAEKKAEALTCQRCDLWRTRTRVVFGEGDPFASVMLVGEGPGATEDKTGRPFVGRAGQLLERALAEAGLHREDVWLTNLVRSRPCTPQGQLLRNRPPLAGEVAACEVWLEAELGLVRPRVVVCLGAVPASYLIHKNFRINAERGAIFELRGSKRLATFHPSYPLRLEGATFAGVFANLVEDLRLAVSLAAGS
jgi:uracil-DNA glycosylase